MFKNSIKISTFVFFILCGFFLAGCTTTSQLESGITGMQEVPGNTQTIRMKTELRDIQQQVEQYYISNSNYPESLKEAGINDTILEQEVKYLKTSDSEYILQITLPDGTPYTLSGNAGAGGSQVNKIQDVTDQFNESLTKDIDY